MENVSPDQTIREIVEKDYRTADVFKKWGISYCCSGNVSLGDVCIQQNLDSRNVLKDIEEATQNLSISNVVNYEDWPLDFLVDYIVYVHHGYIRQAGKTLVLQLEGFVDHHKKKHPYLVEVQEAAVELITELIEHIGYEEEMIFPYIKQISNTFSRREVYGRLFVRTLRKPLHQMNEPEHLRIQALTNRLQAVTNNYQLPENACTNHKVVYKKLQEFDKDLTHHQFLEDQILIPRAVEMEKELLHL